LPGLFVREGETGLAVGRAGLSWGMAAEVETTSVEELRVRVGELRRFL
jgi:hypothetical protein